MKLFHGYESAEERDKRSDAAGIAFDPEEGVTQQQYAEEVDINTIVKRFGLTGELPQNLNMPRSGDFTEAKDFHTAMNVLRQAEEEFLRVPAEIRKRFSNDPGELIAFLEDGKNREEAVRLGLVNPAPEKTRDVVQAVDELASKLVPPKA